MNKKYIWFLFLSALVFFSGINCNTTGYSKEQLRAIKAQEKRAEEEEAQRQSRKLAEAEAQKRAEEQAQARATAAKQKADEDEAKRIAEKEAREKRATQSQEEWRKWIAANIDLNHYMSIYRYLKLSIFDIFEELKLYTTDLQRKVFLQSKEAVPYTKEVEMVKQYILNYEFHEPIYGLESVYDVTAGGFWLRGTETDVGFMLSSRYEYIFWNQLQSIGSVLLKVPENVAVNIEGNHNIGLKIIYKIKNAELRKSSQPWQRYYNHGARCVIVDSATFVIFNKEKNTDIYTVKEIKIR
jgi:hypothetical protein